MRVIYVTREELSTLERAPTSLRDLYEYESRVRDVEAGDASAASAASVPEGLPTLAANFTEAELRKYQKACAKLKSSSEYRSFRTALSIGETNAKKALGFVHLVADAKSAEVEKDAYSTVARFIATAKHDVRSSKDFTGELPDVPEETRGRIMKLIDECGLTGSLRSAFELDFVRAKLCIVGAKGQKLCINVLRREGRTDAVFCPSFAVAKAFAKLVGLDALARDRARRKGDERRDRYHPPTEPDIYRPMDRRPRISHHLALFPYVRELIHGYYVAYLADIDARWRGRVRAEFTMWVPTEFTAPTRDRA